MDKTGEKFFRVYKEADLPGFDFSEFKPAKGDKEDCLVDSTQDDDVNTDTEVLNSGTNTCYKDLLVVKDYLKHRPDKVRRALKTWKIWAPYFQGQLPIKGIPSAQKRFASMDRMERDRAASARKRLNC